VIDLRSDTITRPTAAMKQAMMEAALGDDVFGEDPTVNQLEEFAARMFGMEAALFCPSGTMTNQIAIKLHTQPGDEVICDVHSHIFNYEGGGIAFNSSAQARLINGDRGRINASQVEASINADHDWLARTALVSLENTVNRAGGSYYTLQEIIPVYEVCKKHHLKFHLDGARLFNALTETGESCNDWGAYFDTISICLSKGLGAPVGSLLLGSKAAIKQARRIRKVFGGGMRQAGLLAAAGLYALQHHVERLKTDHHHAQIIADALKEKAWVKEIMPVSTNIIIFHLTNQISSAELAARFAEHKVLISPFGGATIRMVTHLDIDAQQIDQLVEIIRKL
jgi:threonine aldolase